MVVQLLKVLVWNVRGLNSPARRHSIFQVVASADPSIVCFQETKMYVMDQYNVMQCLGPSFDGFAYLPATETRGGILVGWDTSVLAMDNFTFDQFALTGLVHNKDGWDRWLTVVYGPQGDELKTQFLVELQHRRDLCPGPWMVLGDFNMILNANEKNNVNLNRNMMRRFRKFVENNELKEICMHGMRFT